MTVSFASAKIESSVDVAVAAVVVFEHAAVVAVAVAAENAGRQESVLALVLTYYRRPAVVPLGTAELVALAPVA